ncbi:MAG: 5-oxoprolinase subunit PxpB [Chitinophagaceae bacterium]|nr:5-oxoprolinase subunit PxpB [Chitinophagaceae bacterium]
MTTGIDIYPLGDHAITLEFGNVINLPTNQKVVALFKHLQTNPFIGLVDLIPAYTTLTLVYDIAVINQHRAVHQTTYQWVEDLILRILQTNNLQYSFVGRTVKIPVCYHSSLAPDTEWLAHHHNLTVNEVIELHTSTTYHVYMLGFLPGFPYMATVPEKIATQRKSNPRKQVAAGSVGIAGNQTGIYPFDSPGGWQLIGQTPLKNFDVEKMDPALLLPGDAVTFYAISLDEFNLQKQA